MWGDSAALQALAKLFRVTSVDANRISEVGKWVDAVIVEVVEDISANTWRQIVSSSGCLIEDIEAFVASRAQYQEFIVDRPFFGVEVAMTCDVLCGIDSKNADASDRLKDGQGLNECECLGKRSLGFIGKGFADR